MVRVRIGDEIVSSAVKAKIRLDYKGEGKPSKFLFGGKNVEEVAEETREQKVALLRNVPTQGIQIEDIDMSSEVYVVRDEVSGSQVAFAPVQITVTADSLEDLGRFIVTGEFRKIEILEPEQVYYSRLDLERFLFKISQEIKIYSENLQRRLNAK